MKDDNDDAHVYTLAERLMRREAPMATLRELCARTGVTVTAGAEHLASPLHDNAADDGAELMVKLPAQRLGRLLVTLHNIGETWGASGASINDSVHRKMFGRPLPPIHPPPDLPAEATPIPWKWYLEPTIVVDRLCRSPVGAWSTMIALILVSIEAAGATLLQLESSMGAVDARNEQCTLAFACVAIGYLLLGFARWDRAPREAVLECLVFCASTVVTGLALVHLHPTCFRAPCPSSMPPPQGFFLLLGVAIATSRITWRTVVAVILALFLAVSAVGLGVLE